MPKPSNIESKDPEAFIKAISPLAYFGNRTVQLKDIFKLFENNSHYGKQYQTCFDLFSGSGSIILYAMQLSIAKSYVFNDAFLPLSLFWKFVKESPDQVIQEYRDLTQNYLSSDRQEEFYTAVQNDFNQAITALNNFDECSQPRYAAMFAFIINNSENGIPFMTQTGSAQLLACKRDAKKSNFSTEIFSENVKTVNNLFKKNQVRFAHSDFSSFISQASEHDLVILDPPYPDMPDTKETKEGYIYYRTDDKFNLQRKLNDFIHQLDRKNITFFMFYGVLGMENHYPIVWPEGHVLRLSGSANGPFQEYIEHLYLSRSLAKVILHVENQGTIQPNFHRIFETHALQGLFKNGDKICLVFDNKQYTYAQINRAANRLAQYLTQCTMPKVSGADTKDSIPEEKLTIIYLERGPQLIISLLACLKAGIAYLPLEANLTRLKLDAAYERMSLSGAKFIITHPELEQSLQGLNSKKIKWKKIITVQKQDFLCEQTYREIHSDTNLNKTILPNDLAYVMFTSGSTGTPKGVEILHRGLAYAFESHQDLLNLGPEDRVAQFSSIGFDASLMEIMMALASGARLYLVNDLEYSDHKILTHFLKTNKITVAIQTPLKLAELKPTEFPDLHSLLIVGDIFPKSLSDQWIVEVNINGKTGLRRVVNGYGLTETTICTSLELCSKENPLTIGKPILGIEVFLQPAELDSKESWPTGKWLTFVDAEQNKKMMKQEIASVLGEHPEKIPHMVTEYAQNIYELYFGGPSVARGYRKRDDLTSSRFKKVLTGEGEKILYKSGDIGFFQSNGCITLFGRVDRQHKIRGQRIELDEVEYKMKELKSIVKEVRTIAYAQKSNFATSNSLKILVVYIVPHDEKLVMREKKPSAESLKALEQISSYMRKHTHSSMCPALIHMKFVDKLPRKNNDKSNYDDKVLHDLGVPLFDLPESKEDPLEDISGEEKSLLCWLKEIYAKCLKLNPSQIRYEYKFEDLGGDSISVAYCIALLHEEASKHPRYLEFIMQLNATDIISSSVNDLKKILDTKKDETEQNQKKLKKMIERTHFDSLEDWSLRIDGMSYNQFYSKLCLPVFAIHSLLGDAQLDYSSSVLQNLPSYISPISMPSVSLLEKWEQESKDVGDKLNRLLDYYAHHIKIISKEQVCWLIGWSSGGWIVKKLSQKLRAQGIKTFVFLLDTDHPEILAKLSAKDLGKKLQLMGEKIIDTIQNYYGLKAFSPQLLKQGEDNPYDFSEKYFAHMRQQFDLFVKESKQNDSFKSIELAKRMIMSAQWLFLSQLQEVEKLNFHPDDTLVIASQNPEKSSLLGWDAKKDQCITVDADHFNLLSKEELKSSVISQLQKQLKELENPLYEGLIQYWKGEDEKAINSFNKYLTTTNRHQEQAYLHRGQIFQKRGQYDEAIADFNRVIEETKDLIADGSFDTTDESLMMADDKANKVFLCVLALISRSSIFLEMNNPDYASIFKDLERAELLSKNSDHLSEMVHSAMAHYYGKVNNHVKAIQCYSQLIKKNPTQGIYYKERARLKMIMGDARGTINDFTQALSLSYENQQIITMPIMGIRITADIICLIYLGRAGARYQVKDYAGCFRDIEQAIDRNPTFILSYMVRMGFNFELKKFDNVIKDCQTILFHQEFKSLPNDAQHHVFIVKMKACEALKYYREALETANAFIILTENPTAYLSRIFIILNYFKNDRALLLQARNDCLRIKTQDPKNAKLISQFLLTINTELGLFEEIIKDSEYTIKVEPKNSEALFRKAHSLFCLGNWQEAVQLATQAIECAPEKYLAEYYAFRGNVLSTYSLDEKELKGALQDFDNAIKRDPNIGKHYHCRGSLKNKVASMRLIKNIDIVKMIESAISDFKKSLELEPNNQMFALALNLGMAALYANRQCEETEGDQEVSDQKAIFSQATDEYAKAFQSMDFSPSLMASFQGVIKQVAKDTKNYIKIQNVSSTEEKRGSSSIPSPESIIDEVVKKMSATISDATESKKSSVEQHSEESLPVRSPESIIDEVFEEMSAGILDTSESKKSSGANQANKQKTADTPYVYSEEEINMWLGIAASMHFLDADQTMLEECINFCTKIIKQNPNHIEAYMMRGRIRQKLTHLTESLEDFKKVIHVQTENYEAHARIAQIYIALGKPFEALDAANLSVKYCPSNVIEPYLIRGSVCVSFTFAFEKEEHIVAIADFEEILKRTNYIDHRVNAHIGVGSAKQAMVRFLLDDPDQAEKVVKEAIKEFNMALQLDPENLIAKSQLKMAKVGLNMIKTESLAPQDFEGIKNYLSSISSFLKDGKSQNTPFFQVMRRVAQQGVQIIGEAQSTVVSQDERVPTESKSANPESRKRSNKKSPEKTNENHSGNPPPAPSGP